VAGLARLRKTSVARFSFFRAAARPGFVFFCRHDYALALMRHPTAHVELVRRGSFGTKLSPLAGIFSQHPHPRVRPLHDQLRAVLREADVLGPSSVRHATQLPARVVWHPFTTGRCNDSREPRRVVRAAARATRKTMTRMITAMPSQTAAAAPLKALDDPLAARRLHAVALHSEHPTLGRAALTVDRQAGSGCGGLRRLGLALHAASILAEPRTPAGYWAGDV
jgi:hypothetical protein